MSKKTKKTKGIGYINKFDDGGELRPQTPTLDFNNVNTRIDIPNNSPITPGSSEALSGINPQIRTNNPFDAKDFARKASAIGGAALSIGKDVVNMSRIKDTSPFSSSYNSYANTLFNTSNNDSVLNQYNSQGGLEKATYSKVGGMSGGDIAKGVGSTAVKGAIAGAKFGPLGAAIGGVAGGIAGGIGSIVNGRRAKNAEADLSRKRSQAFAQNISNLSTGVQNANTANFNQGLVNLAANGGPFNFYSPGDGPIEYETSYNKNLPKFMQNTKNSSIFAMGGNMSTNGGNFSEGYIEVGEGGSHEENPNQGVQIGVDPQGTPNMVEEGEVIYKDYVFSKRLNITKDLLESYNLPTSYKNMSFADVANKITKKFKETPNDPITKRTIDSNMQRLMEAQEEVRAEQEPQQPTEIESIPQEAIANQEQVNPEEQIAQERQPMGMEQILGQQQPFACGGKINKFETGSFMNINNNFNDNGWDYSQFTRNGSRMNPKFVNWYYQQNPAMQYQKGVNPFASMPYGDLKKWATKWTNNPNFVDFRQIYDTNHVGDGYKNWETSTEDGNLKSYLKQFPQYKDVPKENQPPLYYESDLGDLNKFPTLNGVKNTRIRTDNPFVPNTNTVGLNGFNPYKYHWNTPNDLEDKNNGLLSSPLAVNNSIPITTEPGQINVSNDGIAEEDSPYVYDQNNYNRPTWYRYVPAFGSILGLGMALKSADYSNAKRIEDTANAAGNYTPVSFNGAGTFMQYKPVDKEWDRIRQDAYNLSKLRMAQNNSGGNRHTANAIQQSYDYNNRLANAEALHSGDKENWVRYNESVKHNTAVNQFNSKSRLQADITNAELLSKAKQSGLSGIIAAAQMRNAIDDARNASISANLTNLFDNIGAIGKENYQMNDRDMLISAGIFGMPATRPQGWSKEQWQTYQQFYRENYKEIMELRKSNKEIEDLLKKKRDEKIV